ncbi:MAG: FimV/HubP family polar landmark protein [Betaproteobacteria bacterium]
MATPCVAQAAGLGQLTVQSALGQPFQAEIDLISVPKEELGSLSVRLASPAAYQQAGLQYSSIIAGLALRIERRPNGQPYIKVTSSRPVNEFVVDVLIDVSWASGRIMREYRALLDPPGVTAPVVAESRPAPPPAQPAVQRAAPIASAPVTSGEGTYGPVKRGQTLSQIAREVRPEGVSVEQMLVGLYRSNPDAFIRKNLNLVRSGKILRVPERSEVQAISQSEAVKEYRAQVADWNSYRQRLADTAAPAPEGKSAASGKITARVDERSPGDTRDVVRLSKGEPPGPPTGARDGREAGAKERIRALEEEIIAREKALKEANERVAELEKTIKDMQRLMEIKSAGMAAAQQKVQAAPQPDAPAKPPAETVAQAAATPDKPKPEAPKPQAAKPKPPVKPAAVPLPPEPSLAESLLSNPLNLAGIAIVLLGGVAFWVVRRRRADATRTANFISPTLGGGEPVLAPGAAGAALGAAISALPAAAPASAPDVDPLEEASVYVTHGRDAQAEAILKDALARDPRREAVHLKLLEVYAARKDKNEFAKHAADYRKLTRGEGANWVKAAAMGYALDAANPLYAAGKDLATPAATDPARSVDVDLDLDLTAPAPAKPDVELDGGSQPAAGETKETAPDRPLAAPPAAARAPAAPQPDFAPLDFQIDLPPAGGGGSTEPKPDTAAAFRLPDIDLDLDGKPQAAAAVAGSKDAHWYDVQAKFDLAKAYEEMGDKAGARQILQEVIREGDAEQQAQAKQLLAGIG